MVVTYIDETPVSSGSKITYLDEQPEIKQDYPIRRKLMNYIGRPVIEGGAMTVGGLAGTTLAGGNPLGGVALSAALYPPAHEFANRLDETLGIAGRQRPAGTLSDQLGKMAGEFQTGLETETGARALGPIVNKGIETVVRGGIPTLLGPSREAVAARLANPAILQNAPSYLSQAERLPKVLDGIKTGIEKAYNRASSFLRNSPEPSAGAVPVSQVANILGDLQNELKVGQATVGASDKSATTKLQSLVGDVNDIIKRPTPAPILGPTGQPIILKKAEAFLPETTLHKVIQRIRKDINWDDKSASVANSVLTDVSGQLDTLLKTGNQTYARGMKPVAALTRLYNDSRDAFSLTKRTGEGLQPTDATISAMKSLPQERRGITQKVAQRIKAVTKEDFVKNSKTRALAEQFIGGNAQGSRRTLGGGVIGTALGTGLGHVVGYPGEMGTLGSMAGGLVGMATDTSGREMAGRIIDTYFRAKPFLAKIPYDIAVRLISSGVLGSPEEQMGGNSR